jgi:exodeoxyribonuclease-3
MRIISWNVNGLRAVMAKGFPGFLAGTDFDVLCLQETKLQLHQVPPELAPRPGAGPRDATGMHTSWSFALKKGYSGVAVLSKPGPLSVTEGLGDGRWDSEGRCLIAEYPSLVLANVYFPNGQAGEERLRYKLGFYDAFFRRMEAFRNRGRAVLVCGDFNTAHKEIDLANPAENSDRSGFLPVEREWIDRVVGMGYVDTFRHLHPGETAYSWWSYRFQSRLRNIGWRIDYCFLDRPSLGRLKDAFIMPQVPGSDHCPVGVDLAP